MYFCFVIIKQLNIFVTMISVLAKQDTNNEHPISLVECPKCGQKLFDVRFVTGAAVIRIKCRRCKSFIIVDISK